MKKVILFGAIFILTSLTIGMGSCAPPAGAQATGAQAAGAQAAGMIILLLTLLVFFVPWLIAVIKLKNNDIDNTSKVLWAIFVTWTPIIGPICFFIINSKNKNQ